MQYGNNDPRDPFEVGPLDDSLDHVVLSFHEPSPVQVQQGDQPIRQFGNETTEYDDWRPFPPPVEHAAAD